MCGGIVINNAPKGEEEATGLNPPSKKLFKRMFSNI